MFLNILIKISCWKQRDTYIPYPRRACLICFPPQWQVSHCLPEKKNKFKIWKFENTTLFFTVQGWYFDVIFCGFDAKEKTPRYAISTTATHTLLLRNGLAGDGGDC